MSAMHESQPCAQRSTGHPSSWWQRGADLIAALALVVAVTPMALAQPVEISYNTFLDPNNANDPRAAAQTKMIAEFERQNPNIKVRVVVDPTGREWRAHPPHPRRFAGCHPRDQLSNAGVRRHGLAAAARRPGQTRQDRPERLAGAARGWHGPRAPLRPPAGLPHPDPDLPQASSRRGKGDAAAHVGRSVRSPGAKLTQGQRGGVCDPDWNDRWDRGRTGVWRVPPQYARWQRPTANISATTTRRSPSARNRSSAARRSSRTSS